MKIKHKLLALGAMAVSSVLLSSAFAHESRVLPADKNGVRLASENKAIFLLPIR